MAGRLADTVSDSLLDLMFGGVAYTPPATYYIGLSTTTPTNTGTNVTEPAGGAYARVAVVNNTTNWPAASARSKSNGTQVTFPQATASWGTVTDFVIYDAATAGNFIGWGPLNTAETVNTNMTPDFPVGALTVNAPGT